GTALVETGNDDGVLDLLGDKTEPGTGRTVRAAVGQHVVEDRRQQVDWDDHVDVAAQFAAAGVLYMKRAAPDEPAVGADQGGAAFHGSEPDRLCFANQIADR